MKKLLKKFSIFSLGLIITVSVLNNNTPHNLTFAQSLAAITSHQTSENGAQVSINYCLNQTGKVTVGIYQAVDASTTKIVNILVDAQSVTNGCYSQPWAKNFGKDNQFGKTTEVVPNGDYFYSIHFLNAANTYEYKSGWVKVGDSGSMPVNNNPISPNANLLTSFEVKNSKFDPEDNEEAEFKFTLSQGAYLTLEIFDEDDDRVVKIKDEKYYEAGSYTLEWDGEDRFGDQVDEDDEYTYEFTVEKDGKSQTKTGELEVNYSGNGKDDNDDETLNPRLKDVYVTKTEFDPGWREKTTLVFTTTAESDIDIKVYDKNNALIENLVEDDDQEAGTYQVSWDAEDFIDQEKEFYFEVKIENAKGDDSEKIEFKVDEDDSEAKKPNVYRDRTAEIVYNPQDGNLNINFTTSRDSEVTVEILDRGKVIATPVSKKAISEGQNQFYWVGRDKNQNPVPGGIYEYKITAENSKGKDIEKGQFTVIDTDGLYIDGGNCGGFTDVAATNQYCTAISWAKTEGIFVGYSNNTFNPNAAISRVEALKVILEALDIKTTTTRAGSQFSDTYGTEWYAPYLQSGVNLGVVSGYSDGTFRPGNYVNRIEGLVMLLNTGRVKSGIVIPTVRNGQAFLDTPNTASTSWYQSYTWFAKDKNLSANASYFYPTKSMTRAEMADLLYRYSQAGLLNN